MAQHIAIHHDRAVAGGEYSERVRPYDPRSVFDGEVFQNKIVRLIHVDDRAADAVRSIAEVGVELREFDLRPGPAFTS